jgi:hypothetical protein
MGGQSGRTRGEAKGIGIDRARSATDLTARAERANDVSSPERQQQGLVLCSPSWGRLRRSLGPDRRGLRPWDRSGVSR